MFNCARGIRCKQPEFALAPARRPGTAFLAMSWSWFHIKRAHMAVQAPNVSAQFADTAYASLSVISD